MMELEIKELDIREMHWDSVCDWRRLCASKISLMEIEYITRDDVYRFYEFVVRDIERKLSEDYKKVRQIMDSENQPFIEYLAQIYQKKKKYEKDAPQIAKLKLLLVAPQFDPDARDVIKLYNMLSDAQKREFKKYIGIG